MNKKLTNAQRLLVATFLMIVLTIIAYFLITSLFANKIETTKNEVKELENIYYSTKGYIDNKEQNEKMTEEYKKLVTKMLDSYTKAVNVKKAAHQIEDWLYRYNMITSTLSYSDNGSEESNIVFGDKSYVGRTGSLNFSYNMSYSDFKKFISELKSGVVFDDSNIEELINGDEKTNEDKEKDDNEEQNEKNNDTTSKIDDESSETSDETSNEENSDKGKQLELNNSENIIKNIAIKSFTMSPDPQHATVVGTINCEIYTMSDEDESIEEAKANKNVEFTSSKNAENEKHKGVKSLFPEQ